MKAAVIWISFLLITIILTHQCQHDHFSRNTTKHYLNDLTDGRLLQGSQSGKLRIFVDYTQVTVGTDTQINTIKRIMNISASYFYNVLNVTRLPRLYYPANTPLQCNTLKVPEKYVSDGTIGDLGIICGNEKKDEVVYIAKSTPCAFLESNKRPIWGIVVFNNVYLKYDQQGFQQILFVGMHEITHVLGFSASMFSSYPKGNPLVTTPDGSNFLNSTRIQQEILNHYGCQNSKGLPLEDQDGTLIASHWQKKVVGNQYMIASNKKSSYISRFTLALLQSSGFYTEVNYTYAEPTIWGKNKSCSFLNIDNCTSDQFCPGGSSFSCDYDATGIGRCGVDPYAGTCMLVKYFTNTICVDESYQIKNLNARLNTLERGGSSSKCFSSDFRQPGLDATALNNRCYVSVCSATGKFLYILVGSFVLVCRNEGQVITAPIGLTGTLTCPKNFGNYCSNKRTCPYHCNKNGACVNGKCLCTGVTDLSQSCIDVSILKAPVGQTGGLLNAITDPTGLLTDLFNTPTLPTNLNLPQRTIQSYSINRKCIQGTTFDQIFGECLRCSDVFNCMNCDDNGCVSCDNSTKLPKNGRC